MVSKRNRIIELENYLKSCGIEINIAKNKARGNKGYFKVKGSNFRIDIAKNQDEKNIIKTLAHEFAHFAHYKFDTTLKSLDFIFDKNNNGILAELLDITVNSIPKSSIEPLFQQKDNIERNINYLTKLLKNEHNFQDNPTNCSKLEQKIKKTNLKYLLKYDKVKVVEFFSTKIYTIDELEDKTDIELYLKLKSKQRALKRVNAKISRLNKYYNSPTELFARSFELYATNKNELARIAPNVYQEYENSIKNNKIKLLGDFIKNLNN